METRDCKERYNGTLNAKITEYNKIRARAHNQQEQRKKNTNIPLEHCSGLGTRSTMAQMTQAASQASTAGSSPSTPHEGLKRLLITAALCIFTYIVTKPSNGAAGYSSGSLADGSTVQKVKSPSITTGTTNNKNKNDGQDDEESRAFINLPENGEFSPAIAWLMSFPNSGTSYTMVSVEQASNFSTASNYGAEVTLKGSYSLPIYPRHQEGPYWPGLYRKEGLVRHLPDKYVLVKTHCGSRCVRCPPDQYIQTTDTFLDACRNSSGKFRQFERGHNFLYDASRVKKMVHLFRNPFHNMVARFHLDRRNIDSKDRPESKAWIKAHPNDPAGFQAWCKELGDLYKKEEYETFEYDMIKKVRLSPCHTELFKYIQWHNLAFELGKELGLDTLVVHYEDYFDDEERTAAMKRILKYLEMDYVQEPKEFRYVAGDYPNYYTFLDKRRIRLLAEEIASEDTWNAIKHYFDKNSTMYQSHLSSKYDEGKPPVGDKRG